MGQKIANKLTGIINPIIKWIKTNYKIMIVLVLVVIVGLIIYRLLFKEPFDATNPLPTLPSPTTAQRTTDSGITNLRIQIEKIPNKGLIIDEYNDLNFTPTNNAIDYFNAVDNFRISSIEDKDGKVLEINNKLDAIRSFLNSIGETTTTLLDLSDIDSGDVISINTELTNFRTDTLSAIHSLNDTNYTSGTIRDNNILISLFSIIEYSAITEDYNNYYNTLNEIDINNFRNYSNTIQIALQSMTDLKNKLTDVKNRADAIDDTRQIEDIETLTTTITTYINTISTFINNIDIITLNNNIDKIEELKNESQLDTSSITIQKLLDIINSNIIDNIDNYNTSFPVIQNQFTNYNNNYPTNDEINTYNDKINDLETALRFANLIETKNVEFELAEPIISVTDIDRIEIRLKYKNIASNEATIFYDLKKVISEKGIKYYPRNESERKRLSIIYQNFSPDPENMVDNQVVIEDGDNLYAEVTIRNKNGQDRLLNDGTNNKIERGGEIILSIKVKDAYKKALFDTTNSNRFYLMMDFSSDGTDTTDHTVYNTNKKSLIPIELRFRRDIYYSIALPSVNEAGQTETNYVSRVHSDKPLKVYSDAVGKGELHRIMLIDQADSGSRDNYVEWNETTNNEGYLLRSANDKPDLFYKINSSGYMTLVNGSSPFDLLVFEKERNGFRIKKKSDNIYADKSFRFQIEKDSNFQFKNVFDNSDAEVGIFNIDENLENVNDILTVGDYVQDVIDKTRPTESDFGAIYYTYIQRAYRLDDIRKEHSSGAIMTADNLNRKAYIKENGNNIVTVQFYDESGDNAFLIDNNTNESVSEFYIYLKRTTTSNLNTITTQHINTTTTTTTTTTVPAVTSATGFTDLKEFFDDWQIRPSDTVPTVTDRAVPTVVAGSNDVYTFYGIGSTDGVIQVFDYKNEKYKPSLFEGQKIKNSSSDERYVHLVREHTPQSVKSLQPEVITVAMPLDKIDLTDDTLSSAITIKMKYGEEDSETYNYEVNTDTVLEKITNCNESVKLNNLNKLRKTDGNNYEIISVNHPDYNRINFGKCDNILNRDSDIKDMRKANTFVKGILGNLFDKTGDMLSRRNFELSNIQTSEDALLKQPNIKDYNNYEKNSLYDTNPFTKMDEISNYYSSKGQEGFQNSIISETDLSNFLGSYFIHPGQLILLDGVKVQIDNNHIGFIQNGVPIMKLTYDKILPIHSPFQRFEGVKFRIIGQDKMVHSIATKNLENLFYNTGLRSPNFIYLSRHSTQMQHGKESVMYRVSNREYTTLFQMKKLISR